MAHFFHRGAYTPKLVKGCLIAFGVELGFVLSPYLVAPGLLAAAGLLAGDPAGIMGGIALGLGIDLAFTAIPVLPALCLLNAVLIYSIAYLTAAVLCIGTPLAFVADMVQGNTELMSPVI